MKVLHLINTLEQGGAEANLVSLAQRLREYSCECVVATISNRGLDGSLAQTIRESTIPIHSLDAHDYATGLRAYSRLVALLRQERPDIVHSWLYLSDLLALGATRLVRTSKLIWSIWCSDADFSSYSYLAQISPHLLARLSRVPEVVVTNSEAGRRFHEHLGYRPRRWAMISSGFDSNRFRPRTDAGASLRTSLGLNPDVRIIGMVARWDAMKDHANFFAAAAALLDTTPNVHFVLIGRGIESTNPQLSALIERLQVPASKVSLLGLRDDLEELVAGFDLGTLSSYSEGLPGALAEIMASGVPCVATDVGDVAALLGETGIAVPRRSPAELAEGWRRMIDLDPLQRRQLGFAARDRIVRQYDREGYVKKFVELYRELI
jgi:glycosyltransferase involved in cell wall biosynthesis